jgi:hypothetical protein
MTEMIWLPIDAGHGGPIIEAKPAPSHGAEASGTKAGMFHDRSESGFRISFVMQSRMTGMTIGRPAPALQNVVTTS